MSHESIEEAYFNWLYFKVASVDNPTPSLTYYELMRELYKTEFVWILSGDDNRAMDGIDIRKEFLKQSGIDPEPEWVHIGCSVLEMLIAFSRRIEFQVDEPAREWFWIFLKNLGLDESPDSAPLSSEYVAEVLDRFVWRTYSADGQGGLFPIQNPEHDERNVEIWYQFCEYLEEQEEL